MTAESLDDGLLGQQSIAILSKARDECFAQVQNLDVSLEARNQYSAREQQLGDIIDELMAKRFHEASATFKDTKNLKATNLELSKKVAELDGFGKKAEMVQKGLGVLDQIIQAGAGLLTLV